MNPVEQREMTIWGGIGAGVVLIGGIWMWMQADADALSAETATSLHERYTDYYLEPDSSAIAASQARQVATDLFAKQVAQEQRALDSLVFPGRGVDGIPPELADSQFHIEWQAARQAHSQDGKVRPYFTDLVSYAEANGIVSDINNRIRSHAKRLDVDLRATLPFEQGKRLDAGDPAKLSLQLARVTAYAMLVELLIEANVAEIDRIDIHRGSSAWTEPSKSYATLLVYVDLNCTYPQADLIMKTLQRNRHGLALHEVGWIQNEDKNFTLRLVGSLTVPNRDDWNLPIKQPPRKSRKPGSSGEPTVIGTTEVRDAPPEREISQPPPADQTGGGLRPTISPAR